MPIDNPKRRLEALNAAPRKAFSQNFLKDQTIAQRLVDATLDAPADVVWEVGPGLGALTESLVIGARARANRPVRLFEIDRKLAADLRARFPSVPLEEGDFLMADLRGIDAGKKVSLLSNLPYGISSQVLFRIAELRERFSQAVLTFQKEFADRLSAVPRTKDYGALSVIIQLAFELKSLGTIPSTAFHPVPKIESAALAFLPRPEFDPGLDALTPIVKTAFAHRRKKMSSNLRGLFPREKVTAAFASLELSDNVRAEELSPADFVRLTKLLS